MKLKVAFISLLTLLLTACGGGGGSSNNNSPPTANVAPTANFTVSCTEEKVCTFTDTSTDSDGSISLWSWDLDDHRTSADQNPTHTYSYYGDFTVTLEVTDNDGATSSTTQTVIPPEPPNRCGGPLPTTSFVLSDVTSENDLYSFVDRSQLPGYYNELAQTHTYMRQTIDDSDLAESGNLVERYELQTGDCNGSDCDREPRFFRSEANGGEENYRGWEKWYAISFKLGEQFDIPIETSYTYDQRTTIMQFMNTNEERNAFRGNMFFGQWWPRGHLVLRDKNFDLQPDGSTTFVSWDRWVLAPKGSYEEGWNHMVINITFDSDAPVKIWLNGKCVFEENINVLGDTWTKVYFKWGLYRAESVEEENNTNTYINSIYFDNIREGYTYDEIAY